MAPHPTKPWRTYKHISHMNSSNRSTDMFSSSSSSSLNLCWSLRCSSRSKLSQALSFPISSLTFRHLMTEHVFHPHMSFSSLFFTFWKSRFSTTFFSQFLFATCTLQLHCYNSVKFCSLTCWAACILTQVFLSCTHLTVIDSTGHGEQNFLTSF